MNINQYTCLITLIHSQLRSNLAFTNFLRRQLSQIINKEYQNNMSKKYAVKPDLKIEQLIYSLSNHQYSNKSNQCQIIAQSQTLSNYFQNLHQLINPQNLVSFKKYQPLNDGIFILLKGQISFNFGTNITDNDRQLPKNKNSYYRGTQIIMQTFSVFECTLKNCSATEDSYLLLINQQQAMESKFYEFFNNRKDIYDNHYLPFNHNRTDHSINLSSIYQIDLRIHSNFKFKYHTFRQIIKPNQLSIISEGRVKVQISNSNTYEIEKYGVLIPNVTYQVTTASLEIMVIYGSQLLNSRIFTEFSELKYEKIRKSHKNSAQKTKIILNQYSLNSGWIEKYSSKKQKYKRDRQIAKLSKQSQNYSIISSFLCKKNLDFAKKQNLINKNRHQRQERFKNPIVLFNIENQKSKLSLHSTNSASTPTAKYRSKYTNHINLTTEQKNSNITILKKLKLPLSQYKSMVQKHISSSSTVQLVPISPKTKSFFTSTTGQKWPKAKTKLCQLEQETFVRYNKDT